MDCLEKYKARRSVIFLDGEYTQDIMDYLISENWEPTNINDFYENLDFWNNSNKNIIELMFSEPIPHIKQYLLERHKPHVVAYGEMKDIKEELKERYHELGYDVVYFTFYKINDNITNTLQYYPTQHSTVYLK